LANEALQFGDLGPIRVGMPIASKGAVSIAGDVLTPLADQVGVELLLPGCPRDGGAHFDLVEDVELECLRELPSFDSHG
jgi:hypothetical protein